MYDLVSNVSDPGFEGGLPCVLAVAQQKVQIRSICGMPLTVVIERVDDPVWQRDSAYIGRWSRPDQHERRRKITNALTPSVRPVWIFIEVISQMKHVIDRILTYGISLVYVSRDPARDCIVTHVGIEEPKGKITAGVNREADLGQQVIRSRCGFGPTQRALQVGIADLELIVVLRVWLELLGFDLSPRTINTTSFPGRSCSHLERIVHIGAGVGCARVDHLCQRFIRRHLVIDADRGC